MTVHDVGRLLPSLLMFSVLPPFSFLEFFCWLVGFFVGLTTPLLWPDCKANCDQPLNWSSDRSPSFETIKTGFYKAPEQDCRGDLWAGQMDTLTTQ